MISVQAESGVLRLYYYGQWHV